MEFKFRHHYTREDVRALLPQVRQWLESLAQHRSKLAQTNLDLSRLLGEGRDVGGPLVRHWIQSLVHIKRLLRQFQSRDIQVKDLERGLVDFPAVIGGKEVFLCWEKDEADIEYWHDLDTGYAGRELL